MLTSKAARGRSRQRRDNGPGASLGYSALVEHRAVSAHVSRLRVRYAETDQMGVVYYANYFVWMEVGRVDLVRSLGLNYHDLERSEGLYLSVIEANCRYLAAARYDQEIAVETRISKATDRAVEFAYRILSLDPDRLLAEGTTRHLWLNRDWRPTRLPEQYLGKLRQLG